MQNLVIAGSLGSDEVMTELEFINLLKILCHFYFYFFIFFVRVCVPQRTFQLGLFLLGYKCQESNTGPVFGRDCQQLMVQLTRCLCVSPREVILSVVAAEKRSHGNFLIAVNRLSEPQLPMYHM